ncbi:protein of unknown function [Tenacibaculum jejuense]|uniref:Uncharacterized protein n=1 Tax=Tenacibaculum jejuense TaxID=584609 RepID=A0A238U9S2_9FLAO|nr:protein of unknown function [Tenacibaculum jejuense]
MKYLFTGGSLLFGYSISTDDDPIPKIISLLVAILAEVLRHLWNEYKKKKQNPNPNERN